jgi:glycerol-3-phosphate cytidylyltransferase-like family protein
VEFFKQAKALGDYLIVSFASDAVLAGHKQGRRSSIPTEHKKALIGSLRMVDEVVVGEGHKAGKRLTAWLLGWLDGRKIERLQCLQRQPHDRKL